MHASRRLAAQAHSLRTQLLPFDFQDAHLCCCLLWNTCSHPTITRRVTSCALPTSTRCVTRCPLPNPARRATRVRHAVWQTKTIFFRPKIDFFSSKNHFFQKQNLRSFVFPREIRGLYSCFHVKSGEPQMFHSEKRLCCHPVFTT